MSRAAALGFEDDSSSDSDSPQQQPQRQRQSQASSRKQPGTTNHHRNLINSQIIAQQNAQKQKLPSIPVDEDTYAYDEVYESIQESRNAKLKKLSGGNSTDDKGAKYIGNLLEAKKKREEDKLRVQALKIQRERDLEGDKFDDKEEFVTASYKEYKKTLNDDEDEENEEVQKLDKLQNHKPKVNDIRSREEETQEVLKQIEESQQKDSNKVKLLPKLSEEEIEEARKRYFERHPTIIRTK